MGSEFIKSLDSIERAVAIKIKPPSHTDTRERRRRSLPGRITVKNRPPPNAGGVALPLYFPRALLILESKTYANEPAAWFYKLRNFEPAPGGAEVVFTRRRHLRRLPVSHTRAHNTKFITDPEAPPEKKTFRIDFS